MNYFKSFGGQSERCTELAALSADLTSLQCSVMTTSNALLWAQDLKLAHYCHIAQRKVFYVQVVGLLISYVVLLAFKGAHADFGRSNPGLSSRPAVSLRIRSLGLSSLADVRYPVVNYQMVSLRQSHLRCRSSLILFAFSQTSIPGVCTPDQPQQYVPIALIEPKSQACASLRAADASPFVSRS